MLLTDLLSWWYGSGWFQRLDSMRLQLRHWAGFFSILTLLKTLFSPWRQIIAPKTQDRSINDMFRALVDNTISRFVGFWVRIFTIIAGVLMLFLVLLFNLILFAIWPFIPLLPLAIIVLGATW